MADAVHPALGASAARNLANTTKTPPQWLGSTPRWLVNLLLWVPVEAGTFRVNRVMDGLRTEDIGRALDQEGIAVRSGHHCAQPILRRFGVESTVRASLAPYNTCEDIDALVDVLHRLRGNLQLA